jgi:DNA polymerase III, subunit gamma and tau
MSYTALYRKFRPSTFEDVKGQEHIVSTLTNQVKANRLSHAYLFCGTRGTGKTSVAKILAKTVNCENPQEGNPCGICDTCQGIQQGTLLNVIEIDAASNNGVDNIRSIREEVEYRPADGKYKVYIIDEVHMLSIGAFNALLKTLEEPPEYVIFILATTEVHKIPITILSRCQRYDFKRITIDTIANRLLDLMKEENQEVEDRAIRYIAKVADGSMRDALSLLDQCIAFYYKECLTYEKTLEILGAVDTSVFSKLVRALHKKEVVSVLSILEELIVQGRELVQLVTDLTWYLRNLLLVKSSENVEEVIDVSKENLAQLQEEAKEMDYDVLIRYIRICSELSGALKYATQKRVMLEIAFIKMCKPEMEVEKDTLLERIRVLEDKLEKQPTPQIVYNTTQAEIPVEKEQKVMEMPKAVSAEVQAIAKEFRSIADHIGGLLGTYLKEAKLSVGNQNQLLIVMMDEVGAGIVGSEEHRADIQSAIASKIGKEVALEVKSLQQGHRFEENYVDLEKYINMEITIEDEN